MKVWETLLPAPRTGTVTLGAQGTRHHRQRFLSNLQTGGSHFRVSVTQALGPLETKAALKKRSLPLQYTQEGIVGHLCAPALYI